LRDGLQSASACQATLAAKLELLHRMHAVGIDSACLGMPVTSPQAAAHVQRLAQELVTKRMPLQAACAARTVTADIAAVADVAQRTGAPMWVMAFVGISPIRMYVEDWSLRHVIDGVRDAVRFARREGLRVCLVTEDTTRSRPEMALDVYLAALDCGAERICICDTVGHAVPATAAAVVARLRRGLTARGFRDTGIDWHGHNDRGLALASSLAAAAAGADRLHGTALGIGERAGNAPMEQLLANLREAGLRRGDLRSLPDYCAAASRGLGVAIPPSQPLVGRDAYRTAAGVHAAAICKAERLGDTGLAERVYAAIPASSVGRAQRIDVGPCSGRSNVLHWLRAQGIAASPRVVRAIGSVAARANRVLTDSELTAIAERALQPAEGRSHPHLAVAAAGAGRTDQAA
jgi:2-isopropylmalate synthase